MSEENKMLIIGVCGKAGSGKDTIADILVKDHGFVKVAFADPLKQICQKIYDFSDEQLWGPSEKRNEPDFRYLHRKAGSNGCSDVRSLLPDYGESGKVEPGTFDKYYCKGMEHLVTWYGNEKNFGFLPSPPEDEYLTPRYALQKLGTEWGRDCYGPTWIEYGLRVARKILSDGYNYKYSAKTGLEVTFEEGYQKPAGVVISDVRFLNEVEGLRNAGARVVRVKRPSAGLRGLSSEHRSETEQDNIPDDMFDFILNNEGSLEDLVVMTQAFLSQFQIEGRDAGFANMLNGIDVRTALTSRPMAGFSDLRKNQYPVDPTSIVKRATDTAVAVEEEFSMQLGPPKVDGVDVIPADETPGQTHLRGLLEDRQRDVEAGKIREYDPAQADVPPFKRNT